MARREARLPTNSLYFPSRSGILTQRRVRTRLPAPPFCLRFPRLTRPERGTGPKTPWFRGVLGEGPAKAEPETVGRRHRSQAIGALSPRLVTAVRAEGSVQPHVTSNRFQPRHRARPAPAIADQPGLLPLAPNRTTFQGPLSELGAHDRRSLRDRRMLGSTRPPPNFATFPVAAEVAFALPLGAAADPPPLALLLPPSALLLEFDAPLLQRRRCRLDSIGILSGHLGWD
jgi:hypothetical protein